MRSYIDLFIGIYRAVDDGQRNDSLMNGIYWAILIQILVKSDNHLDTDGRSLSADAVRTGRLTICRLTSDVW